MLKGVSKYNVYGDFLTTILVPLQCFFFYLQMHSFLQKKSSRFFAKLKFLGFWSLQSIHRSFLVDILASSLLTPLVLCGVGSKHARIRHIL